MSRRRGVMSEGLKYELAKDLGFYDVVQREGWSGIRTKDAGNMVKRAIQIAQEHLAQQHAASVPPAYGASAGSGYRSPQGMNSQQAMSGQMQAPYAAAGQPQGYAQTSSYAQQQAGPSGYYAGGTSPPYGQQPTQHSTYS
ncbi:small, acid-soluble spore protein, alpha/beta type [Paenibacillus ferrarius]|uniref:small, acid-soluble spore protein, alpha/beta type n=1 Tax=Paenibacillus ferrarius TaxID=1469647 RepID=UPI003D2834F2